MSEGNRGKRVLKQWSIVNGQWSIVIVVRVIEADNERVVWHIKIPTAKISNERSRRGH